MRPFLIAAALLLLVAPAAVPVWAQAPAPRSYAPQGVPMAPTDSASPASPGTAARGAAVPQAQRARRTMQQRFDDANTTHDGRLTLEQARAGRMNAVVRDFAAIDTGNRGYVTLDEIKAQRRAARQAKKAARQQGR